MLAEVLLVLSGHPSAFFTPYPPAQPTTLRISPELEKYLHPGETSSLNTLGSLAWHYTRIRQWSKTTIANAQTSILDLNRAKGKQRETGQGDVYLSALAHGITTVLGGYEAAIVELETKVLERDEGVVQDLQGHVPLSIIVATFSPWFAPLHSLSDLVDVLSRDSPTPGQLMEMLGELSDTGNPELERIYGRLLTTLESLFVTHLTTFVLFGQAPTTTSRAMPAFALDVGPDALSPRHRTYALNGDLLPRSIGAKSRESMLYVGRVSATLRREGRELPRSMVDALRKAFDGVVVLDDEAGVRSRGLEGLDEAIGMARREVGEWLWRYVLTGSQVIDALETFGNYFLTRRADHTLSLLHELHKVLDNKIVLSNPTSSSSVIRDTDLHLAWLRSSVGTSAENDKSLETLRLKLDNGPLRTLSEPGKSGGLFSSFVLGAPMTLHPTISWPLDLFLTPPARESYMEIHAYLLAIRSTHYRVLNTWGSLTARRQSTKSRTALNRQSRSPERALERSVWTTTRLILFFLEEILAHFMIDIIDVQHRTLLEQLDRPEEGVKRSGSVAASLRGSTRWEAKTDAGKTRPGSPASTYAAETVRSKVPPTPNRHTAHLDFLTLRQIHSRHLAFLKQGLLLADKELSVVMRDILLICVRFSGLMERWGGSAVPNHEGDEAFETALIDRKKELDGLKEELHDLLSDFFRALVDSQNPSAGDTSSGPSGSFSRTAKAAQMIQSSRIMSRQVSFTGKAVPAAGKSTTKGEAEKSERGIEAENAMGRHIEQLLLRLDFNGVFTAWLTDEREVTRVDVLAEGGL